MKKLRPIGGFVLGLALFLLSIELLSDAFSLFGEEAAVKLLNSAKNPFVGLFIGILSTALAQSSVAVISVTVVAVGSGGIEPAVGSGGIIEPAVVYPIVMGANIGTTVTNTIVSLSHIRDREEFKRAIGGATVHDFFNIILVAIFFPLELLTGFMDKISNYFANAFQNVGGLELASPLKQYFTEPVSEFLGAGIHKFGLAGAEGWIVLIVAASFLFVGLGILVHSLKGLALDRADNVIEKYIFKTSTASLIFGVLITIFVQSSSITTSLAVPFVATGALSVAQIFPYVCGANIGITFTALLAALAGGNINGLIVALVHFFFNVLGVLIVFPIKRLRAVPVWLAERFGEIASRYRLLAIAYMLVLFYAVPLAVIMISQLF